jgi:TRAP-type mannitol/chloroaromatic compound transport system permease large subunit
MEQAAALPRATEERTDGKGEDVIQAKDARLSAQKPTTGAKAVSFAVTPASVLLATFGVVVAAMATPTQAGALAVGAAGCYLKRDKLEAAMGKVIQAT